MEAPEQFPVFLEVPSGVDAEQLRRIRSYFQIRRRSGGGECGSVTHIGDTVHCVFFKEREGETRGFEPFNVTWAGSQFDLGRVTV